MKAFTKGLTTLASYHTDIVFVSVLYHLQIKRYHTTEVGGSA